MDDIKVDVDKIIDQHNKAAESFHDARVRLASLRTEIRRLQFTESELDDQINSAIAAMTEANRAALSIMRKIQ